MWQKCLGGSNTDWAASIGLTSDSGFIITGGTYSDDGDVSGNHGNGDAWVVKLNSSGDIDWQKCLGGSSLDKGWDIRQTTDGGYIMAGMTESNDGDVSGNHSTAGDAWIVKLDPIGNIEWQRCFGGTQLDAAFCVTQLSNGDYAFLGQTQSSDGDVVLNHGNQDMWFITVSNTASITGGTTPELGSISLYPQPATNEITINYNIPSSSSDLEIEIRNVLGMVVSRSVENIALAGPHEAKMDLTSLMTGCYFVTLSAPGFYASAPFQVLPK